MFTSLHAPPTCTRVNINTFPCLSVSPTCTRVKRIIFTCLVPSLICTSSHLFSRLSACLSACPSVSPQTHSITTCFTVHLPQRHYNASASLTTLQSPPNLFPSSTPPLSAPFPHLITTLPASPHLSLIYFIISTLPSFSWLPLLHLTWFSFFPHHIHYSIISTLLPSSSWLPPISPHGFLPCFASFPPHIHRPVTRRPHPHHNALSFSPYQP